MSTPTRRTRKVIDASQKPPTKRLSQKDLDSSCFRLSRVPQKYKSNRAVQQEEQQPFVTRYFGSNPDALDMRTPEEKLDQIEEQLQDENMDPHDKFKLMAQQKQLNYFVYGEESVETLRSDKNLGIYYNKIERYQSAVRHLSKAHQLEKTNEIPPEESVIIAVELSDAYLALRNSNKKAETIRYLNHANEALKPIADVELEDKHLTFRRDIDIARVSALRGKNSEAVDLYDRAMKSLEEDVGKGTVESANIYVEMGENAEYANNQQLSKQYYKAAYDIYKQLGMDAEAEELEEKLKAGEEEEEEGQLEEEEAPENEAKTKDIKSPNSTSPKSASPRSTSARTTNSPRENESEVKNEQGFHPLDNVIDQALTLTNENQNEEKQNDEKQNEENKNDENKNDENKNDENKNDEKSENDEKKDDTDTSTENKENSDLDSDDFLEGTMKSGELPVVQNEGEEEKKDD